MLESFGIHVVDFVGVRYVNACSNDLLMIIRDAAPICGSDLLPVLYFKGKIRLWFVLYLCSCHLTKRMMCHGCGA